MGQHAGKLMFKDIQAQTEDWIQIMTQFRFTCKYQIPNDLCMCFCFHRFYQCISLWIQVLSYIGRIWAMI
jgi:hypothetical protein